MAELARTLAGIVCSNCRKAQLESIRADEEFEFQSEEGPIRVIANDVPFEVCPNCGERLSGPESAAIEHRAICRAMGLLMPEEIRAIREGFGMTQGQFSKLTGFGEATISRWERGRLLQNRANDRYLRLLAGLPGSVAFLEGIGATAAPSVPGVRA